MLRYFISGRPFRHVPTPGLHYLLVGHAIMLGTALLRQGYAWPINWLTGSVWALSWVALGLLGLTTWSAGRELVGRPDRPRPFWKLPRLLL